ncbi:MAG: type II secretion system protein [Candidatus Harrisonbacteria bacterium]|nr:type II secretion system protein [Candidatus Harrisonbacteria bacterium]
MAIKGFTLLELVIVIGILAILGTVTVLVLNPAQFFAQGRDATRFQDLSNLNGALATYLATVTGPDMDGGTNSCSTLCYVGASGVAANCGGRHGTKTTTEDLTREVDGNGWVPVNLGAIPGGAPLAILPIDPINDATYFYSYACDNTAKTFELDANLESARYANTGTDDKESKDGGTDADVYELGTAPGLSL